ncbi:MAG: polysaccharide deacetylase family protein [Sulfitobacter sp.]
MSRLRIALKIGLKHILAPIGVFVPRPKGVRVLFYHRVNTYDFKTLGMVSRELSVSQSRFRKQMAHLSRKGFKTISLAECRAMLSGEMPFDASAILLTFDDGYADNLTDAAPILAEFGFTATVFPVLDLIGKDNQCWPMSDVKGLGQFMTKPQLQAWLDAGHEIGSHTITHPVLTHLDDAELAHELRGSRKGLQQGFGQGCISVAYPGGDVDARVLRAAREAGYDMGFTTRSGTNVVGADTIMLNRTEVSATDSALIFALKLHGVFDWLGVRDTVMYRNILRVLNKTAGRLAKLPKARQT